ncbi:hypothetical protein CDL15_Pgr014755 [Punica granatum]|nr:hypothetical protein CDL15_Pgr014755 [Punica granatum]
MSGTTWAGSWTSYTAEDRESKRGLVNVVVDFLHKIGSQGRGGIRQGEGSMLLAHKPPLDVRGHCRDGSL